MTVAFTMTERADQLHHIDAPAHSTAVVQALFFFGGGGAGGQNITSLRSVSPPTARFGSLRLLVFPKAKIAFESEDICECDGHTVHKLSQRRLTAD